ncbi:MAG: transporter substrate-binding domain-containing protein [Hyphomicrobiales bacterium]|nr:transporter substrate-binding domain-containing protein [Hyphomicrobiales bacterium]
MLSKTEGRNQATGRAAILGLLLLPLVFLTTSVRAEAVMERVTERGTLVAAAVPDELPLAARDASGALTGFDVEVAQEIAKRLGYPVTFVTPGWGAILAGGWNGKWDFSVSSITPTEVRSRFINFPATYRFDAAVVLVHENNRSATMPAHLSGKRIGVKAGTTFENYLMHDLTIYEGEVPVEYVIVDPEIHRYADKDQAVSALAKGDGRIVDAVVTSFAPAKAAIARGVPIRIVPGFLFWEPVAVAIDQGDDAFAQRMHDIVDDMMEDGTLGALSVKWFGIDMTAPLLR